MADDDALLGAILAIAVGAGVVALLKMLSGDDDDEGDEDDY